MEKMKIIPPLLTAIVLALWVSAIAIISVQNATPISLKFLTFQSVSLPLGIILGFTVGVGVIAGAFAPLLGRILGPRHNPTEYPDYD